MSNKIPKTNNKTARFDVQYTRPNGRKATRHNQTSEQIRALYNEFTGGMFTIWNLDTLTVHFVHNNGTENEFETVTLGKRNGRFLKINGEGWVIIDRGNGYKSGFIIKNIATTKSKIVYWGC